MIRPMTLEDIPEIAAMEAAIFTPPWSEKSIRDLLREVESCCGLVLENENRIAGYSIYWIVIDEMHIANVAVSEEVRGKGFGSMLLEAMLEDAINSDVAFAQLEVRKSNIAAIKLYEKYGFTHYGIRKGYYQETNEDAIVMTRIFGE